LATIYDIEPEGRTKYLEGDNLVANSRDGAASYADSKASFEKMYEQVEADLYS